MVVSEASFDSVFDVHQQVAVTLPVLPTPALVSSTVTVTVTDHVPVALTVTVNLLTSSSVFGFVGVVQTVPRPSYCISVVFWSS